MDTTKRGKEKREKIDRSKLASDTNKKVWAGYSEKDRLNRGLSISKSKLGKCFGGKFSRVKPKFRNCFLSGCNEIVYEKITKSGGRKFNKYCCVEHRKLGMSNSLRKIKKKNVEFENYKKDVWMFTRQNNISILEGYESRGKMKLGTHNTNLDHIYSIHDGYKNGIDAKIIGNIVNLRFLHWKDNKDKGSRSDMDIDTLMNKYLTILECTP